VPPSTPPATSSAPKASSSTRPRSELPGQRLQHDTALTERYTLLFDGFIKYDLEKDSSAVYEYPAGWFGGETCFAPALGGSAEELAGQRIR
jgi:carotenoid cleavage dioxygenase-like enzyme